MTAHQIDRAIEVVAVQQASAVSRAQVLALGGSDKIIRQRIASGRLGRVAAGVYVLSGAPASTAQGLWVAVLAAGRDAVVSHESAAAMHGTLGYPAGPRIVTVAHSGHARLAGITVHQISDLTAEWRISIDGLPVTSLARTFVDLAAVSRRVRLRMALDDARAAQKLTINEVAVALGAVARRGKPGIRLLGSILDELGPGSVPAASKLEQRLHAVVDQAGLPALLPQHALPGRQAVKGCVDGAWPDAKLIVEADSRRWHTRVQDLARDHLRDQEAGRVGWQVVRVMYEHLVGDATGVGDMLRDTRAIRLRQVA